MGRRRSKKKEKKKAEREAKLAAEVRVATHKVEAKKDVRRSADLSSLPNTAAFYCPAIALMSKHFRNPLETH